MDAATRDGQVPSRKWRLRLPERLPNLNGKWLTLYTIVWAVVLPLSILGATKGAYVSITTPTMWSAYGFSTTEDSRGLNVDSVLSPSARASGLEAGDYVIAIDGWAVPRTAARAEARDHVLKPDGSPTIFAIRKPDGRIFDIRLRRSMAFERERFREAGVSFPVARTLAIAGSLLRPALFIPAAILLFLRRRSEAVPAALSLSFLLFAGIATNGDMLGIGVDALNIIGAVATALLFVALFAFPSGRFEPRWTSIPFVVLIPAFLVDSPIVGLVVVVSALVVLVSRYRAVGPGMERLQLRWAFLGLVAGMVLMGALLLGQIAAAAWQAHDPRWVTWQYAIFGPLLSATFCVMALGLIVSILRYRLYDADAVIGRSAAYAVLTIGFVALFAASQKIIELLGQQYLGQNLGGLAGGIGAALAAVAIAPMHNRAQRWAERRFQKGLFRLRHGLPALVGDLRETSGVPQIAAATLDSVVEGARASRAALVAGDEVIDAREIPASEAGQWWRSWAPAAHDGVDCDPSDDTFPVRVPLEAEGHGRVGWLLLGARPDGSMFGKSELDALEAIAEPVARAVQVALTRSEREAGYERRFEALEKAVAALKAKPKPSAA
ncbi:hypothetical protein [Sphingomonas alba]|uniref:PDZ domain-containing protein n=1 Tax=Sphingomonas alba TaxID=2908208 RepID=A0ABT0RNQ5_9SPHN|nr:hypothetical protein [Sphingomonas alba]MCL6684282.1 hypothetical protein [Sphingomonas alba]